MQWFIIGSECPYTRLMFLAPPAGYEELGGEHAPYNDLLSVMLA